MRSLLARTPGRLTRANAEYWAKRWRDCLAPPSDAELRAQRLGLDLQRLDALLAALASADEQLRVQLAQTPGQVLTSLPGVATVRAAAFAAHSLPIERFPTSERLYSATGLAPASHQSATISRRGGISRQGLRVALARHACRLCHTLLRTQQPYDEERYRQARRRGR